MTRSWEDIKWIFEPDGSLLDIYVQDITPDDWGKLIALLNNTYTLKFGADGSAQIDKDYVLSFLHDETGQMERKTLSLDLQGIVVNCYFFLPDQIEFDLDPNEVRSLKDFEVIEGFMTSISKVLSNQVTLTGENSPTFPLIKIDADRNINKVLTEEEATHLFGQSNSVSTKWSAIKLKLKMRFFPNETKRQLLQNANELYTSTRKDKNVW